VIVVFSGVIGRLPVGGHAWISMQYLAGLRQLGHDVYFLEDCGDGSWVYDWDTEETTTDLAYPAAYVSECLTPLGLGDRWIYRAGDRSAGLSIEAFREVCARADLLLVWAVPFDRWRPEYDLPRRRAYIDADPGFTQIGLATGDGRLVNTIDRCQCLFTIGQRIGADDCRIPSAGRDWHKTLSPVSLPAWPRASDGSATHFTSVMQWRGFREVVYDGVTYGQKDREFPKFAALPRLTTQPFRLALTGVAPEDLSGYGWEVVPGWIPSRTPWSYRTFIQESRAEFGVAKHGYVSMRGGWFSDRSVCYLASSKPVLVEDTGLADWLPVGAGVVTFRDLDEALDGVATINADYARHSDAARKLAEEVFSTARVLPPLLDVALN
jgi:hypothetical protein